MQAEQVKVALERLGEPSRGARELALQALLVAADARAEALRPLPRRRHRRTLRLALLAAVVLLISVVGALAGGLDDLFGGPPAPPAIERMIGQANDVRAFASWASPRVIASRTHRLLRVSTGNGDLVLWVAPTRDGTICLALQHPGERSLGAACIRPAPATRVAYTVDLDTRATTGSSARSGDGCRMRRGASSSRSPTARPAPSRSRTGSSSPRSAIATRPCSSRATRPAGSSPPAGLARHTRRSGVAASAGGRVALLDDPQPDARDRSRTHLVRPGHLLHRAEHVRRRLQMDLVRHQDVMGVVSDGIRPGHRTELGFVPKGDGSPRPVWCSTPLCRRAG